MGYFGSRDVRVLPQCTPGGSDAGYQPRRESWGWMAGFSKDFKAPRPPGKLNCRRNKPWSRKHNHRKNFTKTVPCAPRNTTSFIMRANKMGIRAPVMSPATPSLDGTPVISPAPWPKESLGDGQVANELGVNAYGSMKGCIRLKADAEASDVERERDSGSSSCNESDTDHCTLRASSVQQFEERINHGLQRFEILYNSNSIRTNLKDQSLSARVEDQETHIAYLEEENMSLQQRLWSIQQELAELRRRLGTGVGGQEIVSDESLGNGSCAA